MQRWRSKLFAVVQCSIAAGVAWWLAAEVFDHETPFFAPIAAVVSLGTSYGQRLRRVVEVTFGVAIGVFVADLLVVWIGSGAWQLALIVGLAMSSALLLDAGNLFVTQAAVQSIVVATLLPDPDAALTRWTDALIGGGVALVAATVVPAAPLRKPREQAAAVARKISELLRAASHVMIDGEPDPALDLLADARATDRMTRELQAAADEGMSVVASSPFRVRHREGLRRMVELVDPLDRSLRSTRVLVRQTAVAAYRHRPVPASYADLTADLALAVDAVADELAADRMPEAARPQGGRRGPGDRSRRAQRVALRRRDPRPAPLHRRRPAARHRNGAARGDRRAAAAAALTTFGPDYPKLRIQPLDALR